jgi:hypothetical protein
MLIRVDQIRIEMIIEAALLQTIALQSGPTIGASTGQLLVRFLARTEQLE